MSNINQFHSGAGDNVGGNKILNLSFPKLLAIGITVFLVVIALIYWKSIKERFFFNEDRIDLAISVTDSLQIVGMNEDESIFYSVDELVYYDFNTQGDTTNIIPTSHYLSKFAHNEEFPSSTSASHSSFTHLYSKIPNINFKITNNSNKTIFFSKIEIDVESSKVDPEPIPIFNVGECLFDEDNKTLSFQVYNEGWSPMKNVRLNLNIIAPDEKINYANTPYLINYPLIEKEQLVDIFPILRKQGVDVDRLIAATDMTSDTLDTGELVEEPYIDTLLIKSGLGKYVSDTSKIPQERGEVYGIVYGWVSYDDINGKSYKLKLNTTISIYREWGCGSTGLETGAYDVSLCATGKNYKIVYPISQYLKTSDIDNFSIKLICPKSSIHTMCVKLYYTADKYIERYIKYHLIVPRRMIEEGVISFKGNGKCNDPNPVELLKK